MGSHRLTPSLLYFIISLICPIYQWLVRNYPYIKVWFPFLQQPLIFYRVTGLLQRSLHYFVLAVSFCTRIASHWCASIIHHNIIMEKVNDVLYHHYFRRQLKLRIMAGSDTTELCLYNPDCCFALYPIQNFFGRQRGVPNLFRNSKASSSYLLMAPLCPT